MTTRDAEEPEARRLRPGDDHYMAYVGPPDQYDLMGAMQFRLLATLGLRSAHRVLDFGCGSLRAGRLLISFLDRGGYVGVEPNRWLIDDAVRRQIGEDMVRIKQPQFLFSDSLQDLPGQARFDFILAQSIFSHMGADLIERALIAFRRHLAPTGLVACTFAISRDASAFEGSGWVYPQCVRYPHTWIHYQFARAGLYATPIPFFHPRQQWFLVAMDEARLPCGHALRHLEGGVLNTPEFSDSVKPVPASR